MNENLIVRIEESVEEKLRQECGKYRGEYDKLYSKYCQLKRHL